MAVSTPTKMTVEVICDCGHDVSKHGDMCYHVDRINDADAVCPCMQSVHDVYRARLAIAARLAEAAKFYQAQADTSGDPNGLWQTYARKRWGDWSIATINEAEDEAAAVLREYQGVK